MEVLRAESISKIYCQNAVSLQALRSVSVTIQKGEFVAIPGRSGSGKSTLLNILAGLDKPSEGKVYIDGTDIFHLSEEKRTLLRREKIGFVFQAYELLHALTVTENIRLPELKANADYVGELLDALGIRQYEKCYPDQLSGGEQQRVSIARALAGNPSLILADEPTGALDSRTSREVLDFLKELNEEGNTIVIITHDSSIALEAKRVVRVHDGKINFDGDVNEYAAIL